MVFLLKTPYGFDVHLQDIHTASAAGGTLVIADPGVHRDAYGFDVHLQAAGGTLVIADPGVHRDASAIADTI
eukprot:6668275-Heterocapsa_arctica.AAC.1